MKKYWLESTDHLPLVLGAKRVVLCAPKPELVPYRNADNKLVPYMQVNQRGQLVYAPPPPPARKQSKVIPTAPIKPPVILTAPPPVVSPKRAVSLDGLIWTVIWRMVALRPYKTELWLDGAPTEGPGVYIASGNKNHKSLRAWHGHCWSKSVFVTQYPDVAYRQSKFNSNTKIDGIQWICKLPNSFLEKLREYF